MRPLALILILSGCGVRAEYYSKPKDPCLKKRGPDVCVMEKGEYKCSHDKEVTDETI